MSTRAVKDPSASDGLLPAVLIAGLVAVVGGSVWAGIHLGTDQAAPGNPIAIVKGLIRGELVWETGSTLVVALVLAAVIGLVVATAVLVRRVQGEKTRIDAKAKVMGTGRDIKGITEKECRSIAYKSLGMKEELKDRTKAVGVQIGKHLLSGRMLRGSYQDLHCDIWGPRTGKSSSRVIPAILSALGAVLTTSNKRDVVDATRAWRSVRLIDRETGDKVKARSVDWGTYSDPAKPVAKGKVHVNTLVPRKVWVFDPQGVAGEEPTWWWNPLSWVTDEVKAADLAEHFAAGDDGVEAKKDPFFDPEGQDLVAGLLLAAAVDNRPITDVYLWATQETNDEPVGILKEAAGGKYAMQASGLAAQYNQTEKQRSGVFTTAKKMIRSLKLSAVHPWVRPMGPGDNRPHFDPRAFVANDETMYSLSREGNGSAGPLVTALTVAIIDAAEQLATSSPKGRLPKPLIAALDEVANVVRWTKLPGLYSHYGSRGILIMAILQSWSQGEDVWGAKGMSKLWSASNVRVYGGGVAVDDGNFLKDMSTAIGEHWEITGSVSNSGNGRSVSKHRSKERTLTEAELEALPRGRAVVRSSGNSPTLVKTVPWWEGPNKDAVVASIKVHDPEPEKTLAKAVTKVGAVDAVELVA